MSKPLSQILSDGSLLDNTIHRAQAGWFCAGTMGAGVEIQQGGRGANHPRAVWPLIQEAAALNQESTRLVISKPEADYEHNTEDPFLSLSGVDPLNFTLTTGNLIGCVKIGDHSLRISSRFGDEFLKFIIADADGFVELPEHGGTDSGDYRWLLVYLWLIKLRKAFRLGLPKAYETRTETLTQVRGRLDPIDYFRNNNQARYRCTYREHSYDNGPTRLIARTLRHLDSHSFLREAHTLNQTFQMATRGRSTPLQDLLATAPVRNPYYEDYNPVIELSKRILRDELSDFGDKTSTSAFFFDVSMLFEYFVRKLLRRAGAVLRDKTGSTWSIPRGQPFSTRQRKLIPDLVFDLHGRSFVFDVQYKSLRFQHGVNREDIFQLHTYIGQAANESEVGACGLIYPIHESQWEAKGLESNCGIFSDAINQAGKQIPFHVVFLKIPEQGTLTDAEWPKAFRNQFSMIVRSFASTLLEKLNSTAKSKSAA